MGRKAKAKREASGRGRGEMVQSGGSAASCAAKGKVRQGRAKGIAVGSDARGNAARSLGVWWLLPLAFFLLPALAMWDCVRTDRMARPAGMAWLEGAVGVFAAVASCVSRGWANDFYGWLAMVFYAELVVLAWAAVRAGWELGGEGDNLNNEGERNA